MLNLTQIQQQNGQGNHVRSCLFIGEISEYKLKSFYYTLNEGKIDLQDWMKHLAEVAVSICPSDTQQPVIVAIDDTLIEKFGEKFEY